MLEAFLVNKPLSFRDYKGLLINKARQMFPQTRQLKGFLTSKASHRYRSTCMWNNIQEEEVGQRLVRENKQKYSPTVTAEGSPDQAKVFFNSPVASACSSRSPPPCPLAAAPPLHWE